MLSMAALTASFHNPGMIAVSQRLRTRGRTRGKPHNVARVAVMRTMTVRINARRRDPRHWKQSGEQSGENRTSLTGVWVPLRPWRATPDLVRDGPWRPDSVRDARFRYDVPSPTVDNA